MAGKAKPELDSFFYHSVDKHVPGKTFRQLEVGQQRTTLP